MTDFTAPTFGRVAVAWDARAELGEGLCWSPSRQALYWVDIQARRLMRWHPSTGAQRSWAMPETIGTVAERAGAPGLVVALRRGPAFFDPETGALERLAEPESELAHENNRFNDGKCDPQGRFWAGSMDRACKAGTGALYVLAPGSRTMTRAWDAGFAVTNGPAWSLDGRTMWVNETARGIVHAADFEPAGGGLAHAREWLRLARGDGYPDGMTVDALGRLWIAHWGGACVSCHAPDDGRELARVALPASHVTNVAFGGPEFGTLFVSSATMELSDAQRAAQPHAGALFSVETDARGLAAARFGG
jgi:sugar lactone lactonase YvrE